MFEHKYDILRDTWIYREIQEQVQKEIQQRYIGEQRDLLLEIVQARFPRLITQVQQAAEQAGESLSLRRLIIIVSTARTEKEARQWLSATSQTE
jgi:hypothetical protein